MMSVMPETGQRKLTCEKIEAQTGSVEIILELNV